MKIGAGVVVGAVVAGAAVAAYESSVIGSNNSSSSSVTSSLQSELSATQSQLSNTQDALNSATGTISSLNSALTASQNALSGAQGQLSSASSQVTALQGTVASQTDTISSLQSQVSSASTQISTLESSLSTVRDVFLILSTSQATELAAMINVIIPTDSNGPGGASAGCIYFIDRQLASDYGKNGNMYNKGPYVAPGQTASITVNDLSGNPVTYPGGSMITLPNAGTQYFYGMLLTDFWRYGLDAFETYCNSAYGGNFEDLSSTNQVKALTDLSNNLPTSFGDIVPSDFFNEVFRMTWSGFLMDPLYGGNQGMVGWQLVGFNGVNMGNFYNEGYSTMQLMVATTPIRLKPVSLAQYQQAALSG